jgi:hypothetical protein
MRDVAHSITRVGWRRISAVVVGIGWGAAILAALYFVQRDAFRYLDYSPEGYRHHWPLRFWLIPHILGAGPALLLAPSQFSRRIRSRWPKLHRVVGRVYVASGPYSQKYYQFDAPDCDMPSGSASDLCCSDECNDESCEPDRRRR